MKISFAFLAAFFIFAICLNSFAQTNQITATNNIPVVTHVSIDPEQAAEKFNSFTALIALAGAWLMREIMTIGAAGGIKGILLYAWNGTKPANPKIVTVTATNPTGI